MKNLGEEPVFPQPDSFSCQGGSTGISKRLYLAGMAMQGLTSNPELNRVALDDIVKRSIQYADELLKRIEQ